MTSISSEIWTEIIGLNSICVYHVFQFSSILFHDTILGEWRPLKLFCGSIMTRTSNHSGTRQKCKLFPLGWNTSTIQLQYKWNQYRYNTSNENRMQINLNYNANTIQYKYNNTESTRSRPISKIFPLERHSLDDILEWRLFEIFILTHRGRRQTFKQQHPPGPNFPLTAIVGKR